MFHICHQPLDQFYLFRCKQCHHVLFSSDQVASYLKSDEKNYGLLSYYKTYPSSNQSQSYFMFQEDMQISSIQMDGQQGQGQLLNEHPFLMMFATRLKCFQCESIVGYEIQTTNRNTLFMQNRSIINTKALQVLLGQNDHMALIVTKLDQILADKIKIKNMQQAKKMKQKQQFCLPQSNERMTYDTLKQEQMRQRIEIVCNNSASIQNKTNIVIRPSSFVSKFQIRTLASTNIDTQHMTSYPIFCKDLQRQTQKQDLFDRQNQFTVQQSQQKNSKVKQTKQTLTQIEPIQVILTEHQEQCIMSSIINHHDMLKKWTYSQQKIRQPIIEILDGFQFFRKELIRKSEQINEQNKQLMKTKILIQNDVRQKLRNN